MKKFYIVNEVEADVNDGDIIRFEMPSFCSGEYLALVHVDQRGAYIDNRNKEYFEGCRDYEIIRVVDNHYKVFKEILDKEEVEE